MYECERIDLMQTPIAVKTTALSKAFEGREVLCPCTLAVNQGAIYGILGPNGAGKTTLLKLIAGLLHPTQGYAEVCGIAVSTDRAGYLRRIGCLIETPCFYDHLSARENLSIHLSYMGCAGDIERSLRLVGLENTGEQPVSQFSLGMRQRLGIARTIAHNPSVLLLDEPINGLDPIAIREMRQLFHALRENGVTILLSSHILTEVEQTVDRVAVLSQGRMVLEEEMDQLKAAHPDDLEDYLISKMNGGFSC